jgi:hypothetical protein
MSLTGNSLKIIDCGSDLYVKIAEFAYNNNLLQEDCTVENFAELIKKIYSCSTDGDPDKIHLIALLEDEIVAHYGAEIRRVIIKSKKFNVALSSNLVIKPKVAVPLFYLMQKKYIKKYIDNSYVFSYGIVTKDELIPIHERMGWKVVNYGNLYIRSVNLASSFTKITSIKLHVIKKVLNFLQSLHDLIFIKKIDESKIIKFDYFDECFNTLLLSWHNENIISSLKSIDELNKRFESISGRNYIKFKYEENGLVLGYAVTRIMQMKGFKTLAIVDIVCCNKRGEVVTQLIQKCIKFGKENGVDLIATLLCKQSVVIGNYHRLGFIKSSIKFKMIAHFGNNEFLNSYSDSLKNWPFTWYEHDYI